MSDPVKMIFDDGQEFVMVRCQRCKCPRMAGYKCSGCEALSYREAAHEIEQKMAELRTLLIRWEQ